MDTLAAVFRESSAGCRPGQQPWIADIVFDGEDMVFSLADRSGHQEDDKVPGAWRRDPARLLDGQRLEPGERRRLRRRDDLRQLRLQQSGRPGGGLFYWDQNGRDGNNTLGTLAQVPGYNNVVTVGTNTHKSTA